MQVSFSTRNRITRTSNIIKRIRGSNKNSKDLDSPFINKMAAKFYEFAEKYGYTWHDDAVILEDIELNAEYIDGVKEVRVYNGYEEMFLPIDENLKHELTLLANEWNDDEIREFIETQDLWCTPYQLSATGSGIDIDSTVHLHSAEEAISFIEAIYKNSMPQLSENKEVTEIITTSALMLFVVALRIAVILLSDGFQNIDDITDDEEINKVRRNFIKKDGYDAVYMMLIDTMSENDIAFVYACMKGVLKGASK